MVNLPCFWSIDKKRSRVNKHYWLHVMNTNLSFQIMYYFSDFNKKRDILEYMYKDVIGTSCQ